MDSSNDVKREEFNQLTGRVDLLEEHKKTTDLRLNAIDNNIELTIQNSINEALDIQFSKMREYIPSAIKEQFDKKELEQFREKSEQNIDYKRHSVKTVIQWIIVTICGGLLAFMTFMTGTLQVANTEKNIQIESYFDEVQSLKDEIEALKGGENNE